MGKRLLVGWIGLFGVGVFMTGCDCCNKQSRQQQPFAGGKTDGSMGWTNRSTGGNDKAISGSQPLANSGGSSSSFNTTSGGGQSLDPNAGGGAGWGSNSTSGMGGMPAKSSMTPTYGGMQQPVGSIYKSSQNTVNPSSADSLMGGGASPSLSASRTGSDSLTGSGIQQTSHHSGDSTGARTAEFNSVDSGSPSPMGMNGSSGATLTTPPAMPASVSNSLGAPNVKPMVSDMNASLPPLSTQPSPMSATPPPDAPPGTPDAVYNSPPPKVNATTIPPLPGSKTPPPPYIPGGG
jgi:hypothetical protein